MLFFQIMAQALLDLKKIKKTISTQTGDIFEFYKNIGKNKSIRLYYSNTYKDYVLSINFGNCKKYLITRSMWKIFRLYLNQIDIVFV